MAVASIAHLRSWTTLDFFLTLQAVRSHLAAMPNELYLIRLIHHLTGPVSWRTTLDSSPVEQRRDRSAFCASATAKGATCIFTPTPAIKTPAIVCIRTRPTFSSKR